MNLGPAGQRPGRKSRNFGCNCQAEVSATASALQPLSHFYPPPPHVRTGRRHSSPTGGGGTAQRGWGARPRPRSSPGMPFSRAAVRDSRSARKQQVCVDPEAAPPPRGSFPRSDLGSLAPATLVLRTQSSARCVFPALSLRPVQPRLCGREPENQRKASSAPGALNEGGGLPISPGVGFLSTLPAPRTACAPLPPPEFSESLFRLLCITLPVCFFLAL